jgi:hypothetical protein
MAELSAFEIAEMTKSLTDSQRMIFNQQYSSDKKDRGTTIILALFWYDRIWLGDISTGIIKILTLGGCGIWMIIDLFSASSRADEYNRNKAREILQGIQASGKN